MLTRRLVILAATGIAALPAAFGQGEDGRGGQGGGSGRRGPGGMGGGQQLEMMKERLNLSPEQTTKLEKIYKGQGEKMRAMRENTPEGERPSREAMTKLREETDKSVMEVLSKEQQAEYEQMRKEMMERMRGGRGGGGRPPQEQQ